MNALDILVGVLLSSVAAIVPTVLYVLFVWWLDRYEKEPIALLVAAFVWGAVPAVLGSLLAEFVVGIPLMMLSSRAFFELSQVSAVAPIVEEIIKAAGLLGLALFFRTELDDVLDGIVYGALVGFGFAMTENFLYFVGSFLEGGWRSLGVLVFVRGGLFGFTHAFFTGITGAGVGYAWGHARERRSWFVPLIALGAAIGFHALHNLGVSIAGEQPAGLLLSLANYVGGLLLLLIMVVWSLRQERYWIIEELRDEIGAIITQEEYEMLTCHRAVLAGKVAPLACMAGRRTRYLAELSRLAAELAFKKRRARLGDESRTVQEAIARLRTQIVALHPTASKYTLTK